VWTPAREAGERLPVMVWFFGGGMTAGNTAEYEFDGERIAKRGVVMVSVNYRLNAFGFLAHRELTAEGEEHGEPATNFGLLDQSAGIRWVKRNIEHFGGDPDNITIFGQSAGGRSTWMQVASPMTKGLFGKAIVKSGGMGGGITNYPRLEDMEPFGETYLQHLGVASIAEARQMPADELMKKTLAYRGHRWGPSIDGRFLPVSPLYAIASGRINDVRLLIGSTTNEAQGFRMGDDIETFTARAKRAYGDDYDAFIRISGIDSQETLDAYYASPAFSIFEKGNALAAWHFDAQGRPPVYLYRFSPDMPGHDHPGAFHSSDLWFVFETLQKSWRPFQGKHYDLARIICNYWTNFAKSGDPNGADNDGTPMPLWQPARRGDWHMQSLSDEIADLPGEMNPLIRFEIEHLTREAQRIEGGRP
jgi:para-nitrobenzyl esterase